MTLLIAWAAAMPFALLFAVGLGRAARLGDEQLTRMLTELGREPQARDACPPEAATSERAVADGRRFAASASAQFQAEPSRPALPGEFWREVAR